MSLAAAPAGAFTASAPGRLELSGAPGGPRLSVALDRRASCRVESGASGLLVESKDALTRLAAADFVLSSRDLNTRTMPRFAPRQGMVSASMISR